MWIFTDFGFFSIVRKPGDTDLTIRARVAADLDNLRQRIPALSPTIKDGGTDYPYRATIGKDALAIGLARIIKKIDYGNFKLRVGQEQGFNRAEVYGRIWYDLIALAAHDRENQVIKGEEPCD